MSVERLNEFLEQLVTEVPFDHPDYAHLLKLREKNSLYANSSARVMEVHEYEGREIIAKNAQERKRLLKGILPVVSDIFEIPIEDILGRKKKREISQSRFAASYLFYTLGKLGPSEIARKLGGRDHTTIIYHVSQARVLIKEDPVFSESIADAEDSLRQLVCTPKPQL